MTNSKKPIGIVAKTGDKSPESGMWKVIGYPSIIVPIIKGNKMPPYASKDVEWKLILHA